MSFDVNNIARTEPVIKAAANMNNDGGSGGNLGYMGGGGRQKKKEEKGSLFTMEKHDSFELSSKLPKSEPDYMPDTDSWFNKLLKKLNK
ncbi:MAG TPA: hypothetical protein DEO94_04780 [Cyanobacteria bacterium UBA11991]|nr:hypothetical protein [Cyanobacteriota bacterium]MDY6358511.1 hypothetical protein [Cyanobacteriota bacterium]MDY6364191.1 hypothetical protein [Cyanobacteriota bacterium]MDY6383642.1 hypothetical protein [Cyanobacteriota bacterium]HCB11440.1 hypothetical protein [Cyanobacteria bacterium UBA11991]